MLPAVSLLQLLTFLRLVDYGLDFELDATHFEQIIFLDLIILALLVVTHDEELDHVEHALLHLLRWQHGLAILLVVVVNIFLDIGGAHALDEKAATLLLDPEDLLMVWSVALFAVVLRVHEVYVEALAQDYLVLVGPKELLFRLSHLVVEEAVRVLLPLDELHEQLSVLEPVPASKPNVRLIRKAVPILLRYVTQHRHIRAALRRTLRPAVPIPSAALAPLQHPPKIAKPPLRSINNPIIQEIEWQVLNNPRNACFSIYFDVFDVVCADVVELWAVGVLESSSVEKLINYIRHLLPLVLNSLPDSFVIVGVVLPMIWNIDPGSSIGCRSGNLHSILHKLSMGF